MAKRVASADLLGRTKGARRSSGKRKSVKRAAKKPAKKPARKVAAKRAKKTAGAKGRKHALKVGKRVVKSPSKGLRQGPAPTILLLEESGRIEPVWIKYAQMASAKPSRRPSVPTNIRIGSLVGWKTDGGKDRIGVVQEFIADSAVIGIRGKTELIRITRLTKLSGKGAP